MFSISLTPVFTLSVEIASKIIAKFINFRNLSYNYSNYRKESFSDDSFDSDGKSENGFTKALRNSRKGKYTRYKKKINRPNMTFIEKKQGDDCLKMNKIVSLNTSVQKVWIIFRI